MSKTFKTPKGTELPLLDLKGKDYLQVAHRLVWFREDFPIGRIETDRLSEGEKHVTYRATISVPFNNEFVKLANADKTVIIKSTLDYEKCETAAIGRALALCGYGTQFAEDIEEGEHLPDSPIESKKHHQPSQAQSLMDRGGEDAQSFHDPATAYFDALPSEPLPNFDEIPTITGGDVLGEYKCTFGRKHNGKSLNQFKKGELEGYVSWITDQASKNNSPLHGEMKTFVEKADKYIQMKK